MKLFCQKCGNIYDQDKRELITKCPRCGSIAYSHYAAAIKRYFKCERCKVSFKLSEVAARHFSLNKERPKCPRCKSDIIAVSTNMAYLKSSGQAQKIGDGENKALEEFGLKVWDK